MLDFIPFSMIFERFLSRSSWGDEFDDGIVFWINDDEGFSFTNELKDDILRTEGADRLGDINGVERDLKSLTGIKDDGELFGAAAILITGGRNFDAVVGHEKFDDRGAVGGKNGNTVD